VTPHSSSTQLTELLDAIAHAAERSVGVNTYEHLLVALLELLESGHVDRATAVAELQRLADEWPWGAAEALEFTMHRLRWPEVRLVLVDHVAHGSDFRTRDLAAQVLEAFEDEWPNGEIYETYRRTD
jgi:hypothetical protein